MKIQAKKVGRPQGSFKFGGMPIRDWTKLQNRKKRDALLKLQEKRFKENPLREILFSIRINSEVKRQLEKEQKPDETISDTIRRLINLNRAYRLVLNDSK